MSAPLTEVEKAEYTSVIDNILSSADLKTVTRKNVRRGLEAAINRDLSAQKDAIKKLIEARFDAISGDTEAIPTPPSAPTVEVSPKLKTNGFIPSDDANPEADAGAITKADEDADSEIEVSLPPAKKKQKRDNLIVDADARLAAELQAQEERLARGRTTRGGSSAKVNKKAKPKTKTPKKKSAKRARDGNGDSDNGDSGLDAGEKNKRKAGGGFQKPLTLSFPLAELCGETQLSRPQVVKKLWEHIKANDLQDPNNKRQIRCDEKMHAIFKQSKVDMFQMNKLLGHELYPIDEE